MHPKSTLDVPTLGDIVEKAIPFLIEHRPNGTRFSQGIHTIISTFFREAKLSFPEFLKFDVLHTNLAHGSA